MPTEGMIGTTLKIKELHRHKRLPPADDDAEDKNARLATDATGRSIH